MILPVTVNIASNIYNQNFQSSSTFRTISHLEIRILFHIFFQSKQTNPLPQSVQFPSIYISETQQKLHQKFISIAQKQRKSICLYLIYRITKQTNSETYRFNRL